MDALSYLRRPTHEHQGFTVQEQADIVGKFWNPDENLFLRDKKHGLFLITTKADREVNLKVVGNLLNLSGANLRFGDEELPRKVESDQRFCKSICCYKRCCMRVNFALQDL